MSRRAFQRAHKHMMSMVMLRRNGTPWETILDLFNMPALIAYPVLAKALHFDPPEYREELKRMADEERFCLGYGESMVQWPPLGRKEIWWTE